MKEVHCFKPLFEEEIKGIKLIDVIDMDVWVEFDDKELVQKWTDYLTSLKVKESFSILPSSGGTASSPINDGGTGNVIITIDKTDYRLIFSNGASFMEYNGKRYNIKGSDFPYRETYNEAAERHGTKSPWPWA